MELGKLAARQQTDAVSEADVGIGHRPRGAATAATVAVANSALRGVMMISTAMMSVEEILIIV